MYIWSDQINIFYKKTSVEHLRPIRVEIVFFKNVHTFPKNFNFGVDIKNLISYEIVCNFFS